MISVHKTHFRGDNHTDFRRGFVLPGSCLAQERGGYPQIDTNNPTIVAALIKECAWSPIIWKGGVAKSDNFICARWLVFDFDDGKLPLTTAVDVFKKFTHIIGTTKSHQKQKDEKPPCDRFRLCLYAERLIESLDEYIHNQHTWITELGSDPQTKDGARYFAPCVEIISSSVGEHFPVEEAPPKQPKDTKPVPLKGGLSLRTLRILEGGNFTPGERNINVFRAACDLIRHGHKVDDVVRLLASRTSLPEKEVETTVKSAHTSCINKGEV